MTRRGAAVLGSPIRHSLSPALHRAAYTALQLDGWDYTAVECDEAALPGTLRGLADDGLAGVSLTMPLKRAVLPLLTRTERLAADVGAVNTVVFGGVRGEWWGANTDVPGVEAALRAAGTGRLPDEPVCVIGAGATAASALAALSRLGASTAVVLARRPEAAGRLLSVAERFGVAVDVRPWDQASQWLASPLVVATTPAGATDGLAAWLAEQPADRRRQRTSTLLDVCYSPWPTALAAAWSKRGGRVVGGLELLVQQAAEQVRLMTGRTPPVAVMRAAGEAALADRATGGIG